MLGRRAAVRFFKLRRSSTAVPRSNQTVTRTGTAVDDGHKSAEQAEPVAATSLEGDKEHLRGIDRPDLSATLQIGSTFSGFEVLAHQDLEALNTTAFLMRHEATGANYLHLDSSDINNTFAIVLRTPPTDSTGVAHILEHLVLCGSEKYPVRDPFFNMLKRSLNTFMNAMTASDHTMYPFSTCHEQDFHNLLSVYTDAVFFPKLRELDFMQEGHRIQPSDTAPTGYEYAGMSTESV